MAVIIAFLVSAVFHEVHCFVFIVILLTLLLITRTIFITLFFIIAVDQSLSLVFFQKIHSREYLGSEFLIESVRVGGE